MTTTVTRPSGSADSQITEPPNLLHANASELYQLA